MTSNALHPETPFGIVIDNSTYVILRGNSVAFCGTGIRLESGAAVNVGMVTQSESNIVEDNHLVFLNYGVVAEANDPIGGGTFFKISGNHIDAFRRGIYMASVNFALQQSQILYNKIHINKRLDEDLTPRVAIWCDIPAPCISSNQILFYETSPEENSYRWGVFIGASGDKAAVVNNSFLHSTAFCVNVSSLSSPSTAKVALNTQMALSGGLEDTNLIANGGMNDWDGLTP